MKSENPKTQTLHCKCDAIVGACIEPDCYTDKHWQKTVRKHALAGGKINTMLASEVRKASWNCIYKEVES